MELAELTRFTDDVDAAVEFYATLLGDSPASRWPGGAVFDVSGLTLLLHEAVEGGEVPAEDHPAFAVGDVDATCTGLRERGIDPAMPPADYEWGRSAYLRDPDGNLVELVARG